MDDPQVREQMRADWNQRAAEDAYYYVAFGRRDQDDAEFFSTAEALVRGLTAEFKRLPARDAALEIGCGPGRLMRPLSRHFTEIHGVDVSDEMIRLAGQLLGDTPNAHPHHTSGSDLALFADDRFDFVYSYAVFQHIPSREVVFEYLREARRVLKPGGVLRCQLNGLPPQARRYDTWSGVRIAPQEVLDFAREQRFQLLALEDIWTQYMWITCRKPPGTGARIGPAPAIRRITNALTDETAAPSAGHLAALSLLIEHLPDDADLLNLAATVDSLTARLLYVGPRALDGATQVNVRLPHGIRTGMVPVEIRLQGQPLGPAAWMRIIPPGPPVPRITGLTDAVNLLLHHRVVSGIVKVAIQDVANPESFHATVDGYAVTGVDSFCTDQAQQRYEFNFHLPSGTGKGMHEVRIALGRREFAPLAIEVV